MKILLVVVLVFFDVLVVVGVTKLKSTLSLSLGLKPLPRTGV